MNIIKILLDVHELQRNYYDFGRATASRFYNNCKKDHTHELHIEKLTSCCN
jgi:hypothetical protein